MSSASTAPAPGSLPIPTLSEPASTSGDTTPRTNADVEEKKSKKRGLFGFGKKKIEEDATKAAPSSSSAPTTKSVSPTRGTAASPVHAEHPHYVPSSPGRPFASSPRLSSPAGSQIFERNVQESAAVLPNSPAIPSHIQTEDYIPPVLDASSEAITDSHLNPDSVEIITHTSHQPAAVAVTGGSLAAPGLHEPTWADELAAFSLEKTDGIGAVGPDSASNYGSFDTTDVRRLSFISFADVVQAEQASNNPFSATAAGSRDSMHLAGMTSLASMGVNRSPSPIRSPVSSAGGGPGTSPPTSKSGSVKGLEMSPARKPLGSPTSLHHIIPPVGGPTVSGELTIETMTQALRRTGSGDLRGAVGSLPHSPI